MSEPKLTVGRVETWRPIDAERVLDRAGLNDDDAQRERASRIAAGHVRVAIRMLVQELNARLAPPAPQPEAKAEPDYTCPKCGSVDAADCICSRRAVAAAANARIAELVRERDEARKELREIYDAEPVLMAERHKVWTQAKDDGFREGYRKGVAAAKDACAKRFLDEADAHSNSGNPVWFTLSQMSARMVRETEVPGP